MILVFIVTTVLHMSTFYLNNGLNSLCGIVFSGRKQLLRSKALFSPPLICQDPFSPHFLAFSARFTFAKRKEKEKGEKKGGGIPRVMAPGQKMLIPFTQGELPAFWAIWRIKFSFWALQYLYLRTYYYIPYEYVAPTGRFVLPSSCRTTAQAES